jgi:hypothetical protein
MKPEDEHRKPGEETPLPPGGAPPPDDAPDDARDEEVAQQALEALRRMPVPTAPDIVRARARQAFLRGMAPTVSAREGQRVDEASGPRGTSDQGHPAVHERHHLDREPQRSGRVVVPLNPRRPSRLAPLAFAAAVLLMLLGYGAQSPHPWRVMDVVDPQQQLADRGDVVVGNSVSAGMLESPPDGKIDLALGDMLHMRLSPGTRIMLPNTPRRWNPQPMTIEVQAGELFCTTNGQRLPATLDVYTDNLTARVTGTTFSVWRNPEGTCVCLLEGSVMVMPKDGDDEAMTVPEGNKMVLFDDGRPHVVEPITTMERNKLQMLYDNAR